MIYRTVIDERTSTHIILVSCWKAIGSPCLNQSPNTLKAFDGGGSCPYGILMNLFITLEGNTTELEVQVVDANLNYNILLGSAYFVFLMKEKLSRFINHPYFLLVHRTTMFLTW